MTLEHSLIRTWHFPLLGIIDAFESINQDMHAHHYNDMERQWKEQDDFLNLAKT